MKTDIFMTLTYFGAAYFWKYVYPDTSVLSAVGIALLVILGFYRLAKTRVEK